jgi:glycosyltransferase involved in cell wall biosynthesis
MTAKPKIAVITVCYNAAAVIEQTIESVLRQTYDNIEYVVIDGGSTDGTVAILQKYSDRLSKWVSEPDKGIYDAMNKGIDLVTGNWVYFIGAGDELNNVLDGVAGKLVKTNCVYYGDVFREDIKQVYDGEYSAYRLAVLNICHQAIFYPLAALKKYRYNTKYPLLADHELNMRIYGDKDFVFEYMPLIIANYEGDGLSALSWDLDFFKDKMKIVKESFPLPVYLYALTRRKMARLLTNKYKAAPASDDQ